MSSSPTAITKTSKHRHHHHYRHHKQFAILPKFQCHLLENHQVIQDEKYGIFDMRNSYRPLSHFVNGGIFRMARHDYVLLRRKLQFGRWQWRKQPFGANRTNYEYNNNGDDDGAFGQYRRNDERLRWLHHHRHHHHGSSGAERIIKFRPGMNICCKCYQKLSTEAENNRTVTTTTTVKPKHTKFVNANKQKLKSSSAVENNDVPTNSDNDSNTGNSDKRTRNTDNAGDKKLFEPPHTITTTPVAERTQKAKISSPPTTLTTNQYNNIKREQAQLGLLQERHEQKATTTLSSPSLPSLSSILNKYQHRSSSNVLAHVESSKLDITSDDLFRTKPGEMLNDNLIDLGITMITEQFSEQQRSKFHILNSQFYPILNKDFHRCVQRVNKHVKLMSLEMLCIPICVDYHWIVIVVQNLNHLLSKTVPTLVLYCDSLPPLPLSSSCVSSSSLSSSSSSSSSHRQSNHSSSSSSLNDDDSENDSDSDDDENDGMNVELMILVMEYIVARYNFENQTSISIRDVQQSLVTVSSVDLPKQPNEVDCGLYCLQNMEHLLRKHLVSGQLIRRRELDLYTENMVQEMRVHMRNYILQLAVAQQRLQQVEADQIRKSFQRHDPKWLQHKQRQEQKEKQQVASVSPKRDNDENGNGIALSEQLLRQTRKKEKKKHKKSKERKRKGKKEDENIVAKYSNQMASGVEEKQNMKEQTTITTYATESSKRKGAKIEKKRKKRKSKKRKKNVKEATTTTTNK